MNLLLIVTFFGRFLSIIFDPDLNESFSSVISNKVSSFDCYECENCEIPFNDQTSTTTCSNGITQCLVSGDTGVRKNDLDYFFFSFLESHCEIRNSL